MWGELVSGYIPELTSADRTLALRTIKASLIAKKKKKMQICDHFKVRITIVSLAIYPYSDNSWFH